MIMIMITHDVHDVPAKTSEYYYCLLEVKASRCYMYLAPMHPTAHNVGNPLATSAGTTDHDHESRYSAHLASLRFASRFS